MLDGAEKLTLLLELAAQDTLPWVIVLEQCVVEELGSTWKLPIQSFADFPIGTNTQGLFRIQDDLLLLLLLLLLLRKVSHLVFQNTGSGCAMIVVNCGFPLIFVR